MYHQAIDFAFIVRGGRCFFFFVLSFFSRSFLLPLLLLPFFGPLLPSVVTILSTSRIKLTLHYLRYYPVLLYFSNNICPPSFLFSCCQYFFSTPLFPSRHSTPLHSTTPHRSLARSTCPTTFLSLFTLISSNISCRRNLTRLCFTTSLEHTHKHTHTHTHAHTHTGLPLALHDPLHGRFRPNLQELRCTSKPGEDFYGWYGWKWRG